MYKLYIVILTLDRVKGNTEFRARLVVKGCQEIWDQNPSWILGPQVAGTLYVWGNKYIQRALLDFESLYSSVQGITSVK